MFGDVTHTSSKRICHSAPNAWDLKGGIPQNAFWRLGGGEVCQMPKKDGRLGDDNRSMSYKATAIKLPSRYTVQCGGMEAKVLIFRLRT